MDELRVIIAGGRDFDDYKFLRDHVIEIIKERKEDLTIISGTAKGADKLGEKFAERYGLNLKRFPAEWDKLGKGAGYVRNKEMAKYASENGNGMLIAFWDGKSRGTKHMIDLAMEYELDTRVIQYSK